MSPARARTASMGWPSRCGGLRRSLPAAYLLLFLFFAAAFTGKDDDDLPPLLPGTTRAVSDLTRTLVVCFSLAFCRARHSGEAWRGGAGGGGGVHVGPGVVDGAAAGAGGAGVVAANVPQPVRGLPPVPPGARRHPARPELPARVLPGGLALQVREQALHALMTTIHRQQRPSLPLF
jgi:hypothetical protein